MNNMRLPKLTYWEPKTLDELIGMKAAHREKACLLAGGTDLIPMLKRRNIPVRELINIKKIPELNELSYEEHKGLRIGAAVTLRTLIDSPVISSHYPMLAKACRVVAFNQLRSMGTVGGNICLDTKCSYYNQSDFWWKSRPNCYKRGGDTCYVVRGGKQCFALSASDTVPALTTLEADLLIVGSGGTRHLPLQNFYTGDSKDPLHLKKDELVSTILIPPPGKEWHDGFSKKSQRGAIDFPIATLSLRFRGGKNGPVQAARIALNGVSVRPIRAVETETYLTGKEITETTKAEALHRLLKEASPVSTIGCTVLLRRRMIEVMFMDLIDSLSN